MPTKRVKVVPFRHKVAEMLPADVRWWLHHGYRISASEARELGFGDGWQIGNLHFNRRIAATSRAWTRRHLRELGYGPQIDAHIAAGRCPPDGWRA